MTDQPRRGLLPARVREAIHRLIPVVVTVLMSISVVTDAQADAWVAALGAALTLAQVIVALVHLSPQGRPSLRAAIYGLAGAVSTLLAAYGIVVDPALWTSIVQVVVVLASSITAEAHVDDQ